MTSLRLLPWQQFCRSCCVDEDWNSQFCLETRAIYPNQSNDGSEDNMGTICLFQVKPFVSLKRLQIGIFSFLTEKWAEREMSWKSCYGNSTKGVILFLLWCICGGKFQEHCFSFSRDIVSSVFRNFLVGNHWSNLHNRKTSISLTQNWRRRYFKKKNAILLSFCILKGLWSKHKLIFTS